MNKMAFVWVLVAFFGHVLLRAQEVYPAPKAPFVRPVPDFAEWTVTMQKTSELAKATPSKIREVHVIKTKDTARVSISYSDQTTEEYWIANHAILTPNSSNTRITLMPVTSAKASFERDLQGANEAELSPRFFGYFAGITWISESCFDRVVFLERHPCYHYVAAKRMEAWIDSDTRLPVAYKDLVSNTTYRYTFAPPPKDLLVLPTRYREAVDQFGKQEERRHRLNAAQP